MQKFRHLTAVITVGLSKTEACVVATFGHKREYPQKWAPLPGVNEGTFRWVNDNNSQ